MHMLLLFLRQIMIAMFASSSFILDGPLWEPWSTCSMAPTHMEQHASYHFSAAPIEMVWVWV